MAFRATFFLNNLKLVSSFKHKFQTQFSSEQIDRKSESLKSNFKSRSHLHLHLHLCVSKVQSTTKEVTDESRWNWTTTLIRHEYKLRRRFSAIIYGNETTNFIEHKCWNPIVHIATEFCSKINTEFPFL